MRWRALVAAVVACFVTAVGARGQESPFGLARQVTRSITADPSLAPDGRRMVYLAVVAGVQQLFIANVDGSEPRQITRDAFDREDPAWSPNGQRVAFVSDEGDGQVIAVMNLDGSGVELLTPRSQHAIHPHWAPDSGSIVYCTTDDIDPPRKNDADIFRIDLTTHAVTRLVTGGINTYPVLSPDGRRLAYRKILEGMNSEVYVAGADGSEPRNLTNDPAYDGWSAWSPDGNTLYFPICAKSDGVVGCEIFAASRLGTGKP